MKYFEPFQGNIIPGYINQSSDIHTIQSNIGGSFVQLVCDMFGNFALNSEEDTFLLSIPETIIDQSNATGSGWKNLSDDFHRQVVITEKSSIDTLYLKIKNEGSTSNPITVELRQLPSPASDGEVYASSTVLIINGSNTTVPFKLGVHHLPVGEYHLVIRRNDSDNEQIFAQFDSTGAYSNKLSVSVDDFEYDEIGGDLWFQTSYGNERTFDIVDGVAVINANKTINIDTHITIPPASAYGNRIDVVALSEYGLLEVIGGIVSNKPVPPDVGDTDQYLKIAQIKVYKNKSTVEEMKVTQDDTIGIYRTRSFKERIRRLEKFINYIHEYESPERAKYNLVPPFMDEGAGGSWNMAYDAEAGHYVLSEVNTMAGVWDFKSDTGLDLNNTSNVVRDHGTGTVTLARYTVKDLASWLQRLYPNRQPQQAYGANVFTDVYGNNAATSKYPAVHFYAGKEGYFKLFNTDQHVFENVNNVTCFIFGPDGNLFDISPPIQIAGRTLVKAFPKFGHWFQWLTESSQPAEVNGITTNQWGLWFAMSNKWMTKGWYTAIQVPTPINANRFARIHNNTWYDEAAGYGMNYKGLSYFEVYAGRYPFNPGNKSPCSRINWLQYGAHIEKSLYVNDGVIQSSPVNTTSHFTLIDTVTMDVNIDLPEKTSYSLEVSNNGGTNFYDMTGKTYFQFPVGGHAFVWRIKLHTADQDVTPVLKYLASDGYGVKADLGLTTGDILRGCLVSLPFDGHYIAQQLLSMSEEKFSHWQWVRLWADGPKTKEEEEESGMTMRVSIEVSENGTNWRKGKSDLSLEDLFNGPVDFSYYEGSYDEDEYNYNADTDEEIQVDRITKETFLTAGISNQTDNVSVTTGGSGGTAYNLVTLQGTAEQGIIMHKTGTYDFSDCDQLELQISATGTYIGDMEMDIVLLGSDDFGEGLQTLNDVRERHHLMYVDSTGNIHRSIITLDDPENLSDIKAIAFVMNYNPDGMAFKLHELTGLKTIKYPFFERYLRIVICMSRPIEGINSPSVRKIGVIPVFD